MCRDISDGVDAADHAGLVDEKRVTSRIVRVLLIGGSSDLVGGPDLTADVTQQLEPEMLRLGKCEVLGGRVE